MEGGAVDHVARILAGKPIYVAPGIDFVPYIYTPFYYYVSAAASLFTGLSLQPLRLVSLASTLATFALLYALVRRESGSRAAGLAAAGFYAATYPLSGYWFELARVDSLALALLLGGAWLSRWHTTPRALAVAGALFGLACLTKQTMLLVAAPLVLWACWARGWRPAAIVATAAATVVALASAYFLARSGRWYVYYTITLPGHHRLWLDGWQVIWKEMVAQPFAAVALVGVLAPLGRDRRQGAFALVLLVATLAASTSSMMHSGAASNVLMPGFAGLALGLGLGVGLVVRAFDRALDTRALWRPALALVGLVVIGHELWRLRYDVKSQLMTAADVAAGDDVIARLRRIDGEVYLPNHGYLATLAGKPTHAQGMAVSDILRSSDAPTERVLREDLVRALGSGRFSAILDDTRAAAFSFDGRVYARYRFAGDLLAGRTGLGTRTGLRIRPSMLYLRAPEPTPVIGGRPPAHTP